MKTISKTLLIAMVCVSAGALAKPVASAKKKVSLKVKLVSTGSPTAAPVPVAETPAPVAAEPAVEKAPEKTADEKPVVKPIKVKPLKKVSQRVKVKPVAAKKIQVRPVVKREEVKAAAPMSMPVKPAPPVAYEPASSGQFERSQINFNGLINKSESRKHKLEKRVKAKTKTREQQQPQLASYDMDDVDMKWERAPQSEPKTATPEPKSSGATNQPFNLELIKKK